MGGGEYLGVSAGKNWFSNHPVVAIPCQERKEKNGAWGNKKKKSGFEKKKKEKKLERAS